MLATCTGVDFDTQVLLVAAEFAWQVCRECLWSAVLAWGNSSAAGRVACGSVVQGCARGRGDASIAMPSIAMLLSKRAQVFLLYDRADEEADLFSHRNV